MGCAVRMMTARQTWPFLTEPVGVASRTETRMQSPSPAKRLRCPRMRKQATRRVRVSADEKTLYNPSSVDVWVERDKKEVFVIPAGKTVTLP